MNTDHDDEDDGDYGMDPDYIAPIYKPVYRKKTKPWFKDGVVDHALWLQKIKKDNKND